MKIIDLPNLHYSDYEHPLDAKSLNLLEGTPGLEKLIKAYIKHGIERLTIIAYTGSHLRATEKNFPHLYKHLEAVCKTVNLSNLPQIYIQGDDKINSFTVGDENPIIILNSGCIDKLSDIELRFVLGHEAAHIKSRHTRYHMMADSISVVGEIVGDFTLGIGKLISTPIQFSLFRWAQMSELSADRLGLLACQSLTAAASVFLKIAGLPEKYSAKPNVKEFLQQAREFESLDIDQVSKWVKYAAHLFNTHPWTVLRASELVCWTESGEFQDLLKRLQNNKSKSNSTNLHSKKSSLTCPKCESNITKEDVFCGACGKKL